MEFSVYSCTWRFPKRKLGKAKQGDDMSCSETIVLGYKRYYQGWYPSKVGHGILGRCPWRSIICVSFLWLILCKIGIWPVCVFLSFKYNPPPWSPQTFEQISEPGCTPYLVPVHKATMSVKCTNAHPYQFIRA